MKKWFPAPFLGVLFLTVFLRVLFLLLIPGEAMSLDMIRWGRVIDKLLAEPLPLNPYNTTTYLNGPPFWMQFLFVIGKVEGATGLSRFLLLRGLILVVECGVIGVLYHLLRHFELLTHPGRILLIIFALHPAAILLTCQHTQFDLFVALFLVLFLGSLLLFQKTEDPNAWLFACFFLGLGILSKTVPFILVPLLTFRANTLRVSTLLLGLVLTFFPVLLGMSVIYVLGPEPVTQHVIQYTSVPGYFGITGIIGLLGGTAEAFVRYQQIFFAIMLGSMVGVAAYIREVPHLSARELVLLSTALLLVVIALGPGFGPQYLQWFLPFLVFLFALSSQSQYKRIWQVALWLFVGVSAVTYLEEYAFVEHLGAFAYQLWPTENILSLSHSLTNAKTQTLLRLPLFLCYLFLFGLL